jgi:hypothetical protein
MREGVGCSPSLFVLTCVLVFLRHTLSATRRRIVNQGMFMISKKYLFLLPSLFCAGIAAAECVVNNEGDIIYDLTPEQLIALHEVEPAAPADTIDYFLYRLHSYLTDGTLRIAIETDKVRIPLLINDLRARLKLLAIRADEEPDRYKPFLDDIARRYTPLADAVPDMTYHEAKWWWQQLRAQSIALIQQRNKALRSGLDVAVFDDFAKVYDDLSRIVLPVAYANEHGDFPERLVWWWRTAKYHERMKGLSYAVGGATATIVVLVAIIQAALRKKTPGGAGADGGGSP